MEETVNIKKKDLIKAAELAGGHADVIKALAPEVFEEEIHDEVGSIYDWDGNCYMVTNPQYSCRLLVCISNPAWYAISGGQVLRGVTEFSAHLERLIINQHIKYIGHQRDIMTIRR